MSVLGSQVFGQALMESCESQYDDYYQLFPAEAYGDGFVVALQVESLTLFCFLPVHMLNFFSFLLCG